MFVCEECKAVVGPKISPYFVTFIPDEVRPKVYENKDAEGEIKISHGQEITAAHKLCAPCAQEKPKAQTKIDHKALIGMGMGMQVHAAKCKKPLDECKICQDNMRAFGVYPAHVLSQTLTDRVPQSASFTLGLLVTDKAIDRTNHKSKRAFNDASAALKLVKKVKE